MAGEELHAAGREGALRAKRWLERTTRADPAWVNPDAAAKLAFTWADGSGFSFDLGGTLRGGTLDRQEFFAEVKKYSVVGDQASMYTEYLAKCYRAFEVIPNRCDHFFWITWHPFSQTKWSTLCAPSEVREAVIAHRSRALAIDGEEAAGLAVNDDRCTAVASRLWLVVLCDKQEELVVEEDFIEDVLRLRRKALA